MLPLALRARLSEAAEPSAAALRCCCSPLGSTHSTRHQLSAGTLSLSSSCSSPWHGAPAPPVPQSSQGCCWLRPQLKALLGTVGWEEG